MQQCIQIYKCLCFHYGAPWQALVDTWLLEKGGSGDMQAAPQLLVALRPPPAMPITPALGGTVIIAPDGTVREPASGAFDVTVAPGQPVQAAVDACPAGGSVLLLPGTHDGPLVLLVGKVVHVFGRGLATLRAATGTVVTSEAAASTLDGLVIRREVAGSGDSYGVWIKGGRLRLQACNITSAAQECVFIQGGADPLLASCKCVRSWAPSFLASHLRV